MEKIVQDKVLGEIRLRTSPRAVHYTLKISKGKITATMPVGGNATRMLAFIQENRAKLLKALAKHPAHPLLTDETKMQTATFRLHIFRTERENFYMRLENGILHIACPKEIDFADEQVQKVLKGLIEQAHPSMGLPTRASKSSTAKATGAVVQPAEASICRSPSCCSLFPSLIMYSYTNFATQSK